MSLGFNTRCVILAIIALLITDAWVLVKSFWPKTEDILCNLWLDKEYNVPLNVLWYIHGIGLYIAKIIWSIILLMLASKINLRLKRVFGAVTLYYCLQFYFWLYNKNTSVFANFIVYIYIIPIILFLIIPERKAKIIHLK